MILVFSLSHELHFSFWCFLLGLQLFFFSCEDPYSLLFLYINTSWAKKAHTKGNFAVRFRLSVFFGDALSTCECSTFVWMWFSKRLLYMYNLTEHGGENWNRWIFVPSLRSLAESLRYVRWKMLQHIERFFQLFFQTHFSHIHSNQ